MSTMNPDGSVTTRKVKKAPTKGAAMTGKETKPEPIKSRSRPISAKRANKSKLAMERGRKRMSKASALKVKGKTKRAVKKTASGMKAINNYRRLQKPAIRRKKKLGPTKAEMDSAGKKKPLDRDAKGKVIDTKSATRRSDPGVATKTAPPKRTKGTKHVGQERTAKGTPREGGDGRGPGHLTDEQKMKSVKARAEAKKKAVSRDKGLEKGAVSVKRDNPRRTKRISLQKRS